MFRYFVLVAALLFIAADPRDNDVKKEKEKLKGTWLVDLVTTYEGKDLRPKTKAIITDDAIILNAGATDEAKHSYQIDPVKKTIEMTEVRTITIQGKRKEGKKPTPTKREIKGRTYLGLYELDGDTLRTCISMKDPPVRPPAFKVDREAKAEIAVFKREKK